MGSSKLTFDRLFHLLFSPLFKTSNYFNTYLFKPGAVTTDTDKPKETAAKGKMGMTLLICFAHSDTDDGRD